MEGDDKRMEIKNLPVLPCLSRDGTHGSIVKSQIFCFKKIVSILFVMVKIMKHTDNVHLKCGVLSSCNVSLETNSSFGQPFNIFRR